MPSSLTIDAHKQEINKAIVFLKDYVDTANLSHNLFCLFAVSLDEILSNIINYAFDDKKKHTIKIDLNFENKKLTATIIDNGKAFNPLLFPSPCLSLPLSERSPGGLGIHIVKNIMDSVSYERSENKNILTLVKVDD